MRFKITTILSVILLFSGCKKNEASSTTERIEQDNNKGISEKDIEAFNYMEYALDEKVNEVIQDWTAYLQIQDVITAIKTGDLSFFNDNEKITYDELYYKSASFKQTDFTYLAGRLLLNSFPYTVPIGQ